MSTLSVINLQSQSTTSPVVFQTSTGTEVGRLCRAFVNFDGTGTVSTNQTIRASFNVSTVFKNGTGDYTVNFVANALPDGNYTVCATGSKDGGTFSGGASLNEATIPSASSVRIFGQSFGSSGTNLNDKSYCTVTIFR